MLTERNAVTQGGVQCIGYEYVTEANAKLMLLPINSMQIIGPDSVIAGMLVLSWGGGRLIPTGILFCSLEISAQLWLLIEAAIAIETDKCLELVK